MTPAYTRFSIWGLALVLAFGVLTLWVRERWALACFEAAVFVLMLAWLWLTVWLRGPIRFHRALWPLGLIPLWGALQQAAGWTVLPWSTSEATTEAAVAFCAAFLLVQGLESKFLRPALETALLIFASLVAAQALPQVLTSSGKVFWLFDSGYPDLVLGPFVYHNKYAQFIELVFPLALWRAITDRRRSPLWLVAGAIMLAGVVAGASRAGITLLLLEMPVVFLLAWRAEHLSGRMAALLSLQMAVLAAVWGSIAGWDYLWGRLTGIDPLADHRWSIMQSTVEMIRLRPLTGFGLGTWPSVYPEFATFDAGLYFNQAHCDWLQWAAEGGLALPAAMLAFVLICLRGLIRSVWGIGILAVFLHALLDYPFHQLPAFSTLLICTALLAASTPGDDSGSEVAQHALILRR